MHVKFIARGRGSARAAAQYLLGERDAAGKLRDGVEVRPGVLTPPPATPLAVQPGLHCVWARPGGGPRLRFSPPAQPPSNTPPGGRMV